jgi:hypothetical protein
VTASMTGVSTVDSVRADYGEESMPIDDATYLILRSATGAFTCKYPPVPKMWNSIDRPHVALLIPEDRGIFPVFLSKPVDSPVGVARPLETVDLTQMPAKSIIEVRHSSSHYAYYRRDNGSWTKVAEACDPFVVEVFSHGYTPISLNTVPIA